MESHKNPGVRSPKWAMALGLLQLVFPTLGLFVVLERLSKGEGLGVYSLTLVGFCLVWYAFCFLALARVRRWILTHAALAIALNSVAMLGLISMEVYWRYQLSGAWESAESLPLSHTVYSPELGWKLVAGEDGVGEHGWRGPYRSTDKPKGYFRIVCLGGSTTYGETCPWNETWPHQLETFLNADSSWVAAHGPAEVVNLGVPGYGPDQGLIALKKYGLSFHPNLVILHFQVEDFQKVSSDHEGRMVDGVTRYKPLFTLEEGRLNLKRDAVPVPRDPSGREYEPGERTSLGLNSACLYKLGLLLDNFESHRITTGYNLWPIHSVFQGEYTRARLLLWALVAEAARVSHGAESKFLVSLSPTLMDVPRDASPWRIGSFLQEFQTDAAAAGVEAINCIPEYFAEGGHFRYRGSDLFHLSRHGNAFVARHTLRWLKEQSFASR
jgi:hypothetical protein